MSALRTKLGRIAYPAAVLLAVAVLPANVNGQDVDPSVAKPCVVAAKTMDGAFGALSARVRVGGGDADTRALLDRARAALADAQAACRPIAEMAPDLYDLSVELDAIERSLTPR